MADSKQVSVLHSESNGNDDIKKEVYFQKYKTLKRKFRKLVEENFILNEQIVKARKKITRLTKERGFLLDKLIDHEDGDSEDSATESSVSERDDSPEYEEPEPKKARTESVSSKVVTTSETTNDDKESGNSKKKARKKGEDPAPPCQAVSKGRPCKSKAITGLKYCWHHAPLDPESPYIYCQYYDPLKKNCKQCNIPVLKSNPEPYCNYHKELAQKLKPDSKALVDGSLPIPPSTPTENDSFMDEDQDGDEEDNPELTVDEGPISIATPMTITATTNNSNNNSPSVSSTGSHTTSQILVMAATNATHAILPTTQVSTQSTANTITTAMATTANNNSTSSYT